MVGIPQVFASGTTPAGHLLTVTSDDGARGTAEVAFSDATRR